MTFRKQKRAHKAFQYAICGILILTVVVFVTAFFATGSSRHTPEDFASARLRGK